MFENKDEVFKYIEKNKENVMSEFKKMPEFSRNESGNQSFNGIIGSKNRDYNVTPEECRSAEEYVEKWMEGHNKKYQKDKNYGFSKSSVRIKKLLSDELMSNYIKYYLARTYYKKID